MSSFYNEFCRCFVVNHFAGGVAVAISINKDVLCNKQ